MFFKFEQVKGEVPRLVPTEPEAKRRAVFGVRPCDGRGAVRMDRVFSEPTDDVYYQTRRNNLAYVGLACNQPPSSNCFCQSVGGSPVSTDGLDVLLTDLGDRYFVAAVTDTGKALMAAAGDLLAKPTAADHKQVKKLHEEACAKPQRAVNEPGAVPAKLKASFKSPLWEQLAQACIGCGICEAKCPVLGRPAISVSNVGESRSKENQLLLT